MRSTRSSWLLLGLCAVVVAGALGWITVQVLRLEQAELRARADATHQEAVRLALWRMENWCTSWIATEAARPVEHYRAYYQPALANNGDVLIPSPLLTLQSDVLALHFELDETGLLTSPQLPVDEQSSFPGNQWLGDERLAEKQALLDGLQHRFSDLSMIAQAVAHAESTLADVAGDLPVMAMAQPGQQGMVRPQAQQRAMSQLELTQRGKNYQTANSPPIQQLDIPEWDTGWEVGPLVSMWVDTRKGMPAVLVLMRRVHTESGDRYQGVLLDWKSTRTALLDQVEDVLPDAKLRRLFEDDLARADGLSLASLPVALTVDDLVVPAGPAVTPMRAAIGMAWLAAVVALAAVAFTLRASFAYAEKRSRFASAVTHELRTPLTTFRMYSDMLAGGMIVDEAKKQTYLETLRDESDRLSALVENVLAYARLERGATRIHPAKITVRDLLQQHMPPLEQRCRAAGLEIRREWDGAADRTVLVDPDAIGQVLANLIENACKYAANEAEPVVTIRASGGAVVSAGDPPSGGGGIWIEVEDCGPGIDPHQARAMFQPFRRGDGGMTETAPGIGLGLTLSRGLARAQGGELELVPGARGACFRLTLPACG